MHEIKVPSRFRYVLGAFIISAIFLYSPRLNGPSLGVISNSSVRPWFRQDRVYSNQDGNTTSEAEGTPISNAISSLANLLDIRNETLGFQEINMISLPARTDKQDALIVQAALSGFKINIADGVDGTKIPSKALPHTMDLKANVVGAWRAHLNVLRDMVARRVSSALIFEDDIDWDVSIKAQLLEFARGSRYVLGSETDNLHSPYGDGWDMLWIGHCSATEDPWNNRRWVIPGDPTVVPFDARGGIDKPDMSSWDNSTRIVFAANNGCCTNAYAVSLRGAEKALYHFSMLPYNAPLDWGFSDACRDRKSGFTCISPYPTLTGTYRPAGNASKYSDIETEGDSDKTTVETGSTENLVFSARMNIDRLLTGQTTFKSEFPDFSGDNIRLEYIGGASGHAELAASIVDD